MLQVEVGEPSACLVAEQLQPPQSLGSTPFRWRLGGGAVLGYTPRA